MSSDSRPRPGPSDGNGAPAPDFEAALAELHEIVQQLESGALGLEPSLARFEQGIHLLRRCYETLERAEQRIELLTGFDADGNPVTTEVELTIAVEQTEVEVVREAEPPRRPAEHPAAQPATQPVPRPRQRSVEQRLAEPAEDESRDGPTLF